MPVYTCHKKVWALKIESVEGTKIHPADVGYAAFETSQVFIDKHEPKAGGYYVVYQDGYKSYSPAEAFEDGYTKESEDEERQRELAELDRLVMKYGSALDIYGKE